MCAYFTYYEYSRTCTDWYQNGSYTHTTCGNWSVTSETEYYMCDYSSSPNSGGSSDISTNEYWIQPQQPGGPDPIDLLDCFYTSGNSSGTHSVTIYVDQPIEGTTAPYFKNESGEIDPGHTFINLTQTYNGVTHSVTFGFYPLGGVKLINPNNDGVFNDDSAHDYDVSITKSLSASQFNSLLFAIKNKMNYSTYNLNDKNCSDFGLEVFSRIGIQLPDTYGSWLLGGGTNPGNLGQDLRNMQLSTGMTRNTTGGTAKRSTACWNNNH